MIGIIIDGYLGNVGLIEEESPMKRMTGNLGFNPHIIDLLGEPNRRCMLDLPRGSFDLFDWGEVSRRANTISKHLRGTDGLARMPPQGWPQSKIERFEEWVEEGVPARPGEAYSAFFRAIDAQTEYFDVYGKPEGLDDLGIFYGKFWGRGLLLQKEWMDFFSTKNTTPVLKLVKEERWEKMVEAASDPEIREALLRIDEFICDLAATHFTSDQGFDVEGCLDAFKSFGEDRLPVDEDRENRVKALGNPNDYRLVNDFARFHRMDTRLLWFYWMGHLQCTMAIVGEDDPRNEIRAALAAGIFIGQVTDTAFRNGSNRQTRPEYLADREAVRQTAMILATNWSATATEMQELYYLWTAEPILLV